MLNHNIKYVKEKLSKVLKGQKHVHVQMPCKSSLFSPVFYNVTLFSSCTHGSDARSKISGIFIEKSIPEDGNFCFKVLAYVLDHQSHVKTIMSVTRPLRALQTQWKYQSNKFVNILFTFQCQVEIMSLRHK